MRTLHPVFLVRFLWWLILSIFHQLITPTKKSVSDPPTTHQESNQKLMEAFTDSRGALGRMYQGGEVIVQQGETGNCMYVIQDGYVEVVKETNGQEVTLAILGESDFFGEMAIFENEVRAATVRAIGPARILTIDSKNLLRRIHEDPYFAIGLLGRCPSGFENWVLVMHTLTTLRSNINILKIQAS